MEFSRGNFIDNQWIRPEGSGAIRSVNPATADEVVLEAPTDPKHAALAVQAAARAWPAWAALPSEERIAALRRFARELAPRTEALARAITQEMGKTIREARQEAASLVQRVDLVAEQQLPLVRPWGATDVPGECRYHPLGVIAVLGPFNAPLHVCHAHIMPALATGNCVVVKPSERTPLAFQRYMEAWAAAGLPPVLNMIQGGPEVGKALLRAPELRGVAFTGSWRSGHAIQKALLDRPEVLAALEMGGQNMAIVLEDADLDQALEGVLLGGFMTTGQRCTGTSRVLVARTIADAFIARLVRAAERLTFGDPSTDVFMGPMASCGDRDRLEALCRAGREAGAEVLLAPTTRDDRREDLKEGGAWRGPSIHQITKQHDSDYTREEVFGPDLAVTVVDGLDDALEVVSASPFGLSVAIFSARRAAFEAVYLNTHVGCVNWNRSTHRASGMMPFGGVGKSGNYRAAGSDVVRYATYPVQVQWNEPGVLENDPFARAALHAADPVMALETVHRMEEALEPYGLYPEFDSGHALGQPRGGLRETHSFRIPLTQLDAQVTLSRPLAEALKARGVSAEITETAVRVPMPSGERAARLLARHLSDALHGIRHLHPARFLSRRPAGCHVPAAVGGADPRLALPRSQAFMKRLVAGAFVADDKKPPVLDLYRSSGPYLASVDDDPLVLFDAASQIATHAAGINPPAVVDALWLGRFAATPIDNGPSGAGEPPEAQRLASYLREATATAHSPALPHVRFSNSGAEANEIAIATAAVQRPGRRAIVAFRGAFHGRTLLAVHATWAPEKRARYELAGSEARWLDLPVWPSPSVPAPEPSGWLAEWRKPPSERLLTSGDDALLAAEIAALTALEAALADDQVVCVLIEPMQAEGGERYVTARFMRAVRAITAWLGVPLIVDEVQTGFHLGGPFFWHTRFDLPSPPDIVTAAKKAQLGATLSRWPIPVRAEIAAASAVRGALYAELLATASPEVDVIMGEVGRRLCELTGKHPNTILNPRVTGWSFGFDLPSPEALAHVIDQRLWRGYMVYAAGDRSLRFRLHPEVTATHVEALFQRLGASVAELTRDALEAGAAGAWRDDGTSGLVDRAPPWPVAPTKLRAGYKLVRITAADWPAIRSAYETMHNASADAPPNAIDFERMSALVQEPDAICVAIVQGKPSPQLPPKGTLVGAAIGFAIEHVSELDGPSQDATLGDGVTFFVADVTVHAEHRGLGLGRALKESLIVHAMNAKRPTGEARFAFMTGRRPTGMAPARDAEYGAYHVARYADATAHIDYYRIALTAPRLPPRAAVTAYPAGSGPSVIDWDSGLERRLGDVRGAGAGVDELREHLADGQLSGAIVNKLSLANFVTPAIARAHEVLRLSSPRALPHMVVASGRAEALDKTLRALKFHRGAGRLVASLGPVRAGMATAAARSVTLPEKDDQNWFGWPTLADPTRDPERALLDLKKLIVDRGAAQLLAVVIEPVFLATGRAVPESFWGPLRALLDEHDVPLCLIETTTAGYRNGKSFWRADNLPTPVDAVVWWPGGQLGCGFVSDRYFVADKLALISTWDGDEVSLTRLIWELRTARTLPIGQRADALRKALTGLTSLAGGGGEVAGEGLYLTVEHPQAEALQRRLFERGFRVGLTETKALRVVPPLNVTADEIARFAQIAREVMG